jgi:hypothetical protein
MKSSVEQREDSGADASAVGERGFSGPQFRSAGTWTPLILALGAIALYAIGAVRTAGSLRASDLSVSDTFGIVPLQDHMTNGLAVVLGQGPLYLVGLLVIAFRVWNSHQVREARRSGASRRSRFDWFFDRALIPILVAMLLVAAPWWGVPILLVVWGSETLGVVLAQAGPPACRRHPVVTTLSMLLAGYVLLAFCFSYFLAKPLLKVELTLQTGSTATGPLIAQRDGAFFVGARSDRVLYRAWPQDQIVEAQVSESPRERSKSIPEILGIDTAFPWS